MIKNLFIPAPFFLIRIPIWPVQQFERLLEQENWIEAVIHLYDTSQLLREAIAIASPSLSQSLNKKPLKDPEQTALSLLNYALRMATRATPFGLFSFTAMGSLSQETSAFFEVSKIFKRARPDMEWIYNLAQKIYENKNEFLSLSVRVNPLIWIIGDRIFLNYVRQEQSDWKNTTKTLSIASNKLIKLLISFSKESIKISHLFAKIQEFIPSIDEVKLEGIIRELLSRQFLLPGILPSLLNLSPFDNFLSQLPPSIKVENITQEIASYNKYPLGEGEETLVQLQSAMNKLAPSKPCLQVDAGYKETSFQIPQEIGQEIGKALDLLWRLSDQPKISKLAEYHSKFIDKYGIQRVIPLLELLSEEKGLGSFLNIQPSTPKIAPGKFMELWEKWLAVAWQDSLREKKKELCITEELIDKLFKLSEEAEKDPKNALLSLDVFCKIIAASPEDISQGSYQLLLSQTTQQGCSTLGRFFDLFDEKNQLLILDFIRAEEELENHTCFLELSYWPSSIRTANVAIHPCFRAHRLDIEKGKDRSFSLEDIYVGATLDRFYLSLKEGGVEIDACIGNLLNLNYAPLPLQFMREVTLAKRQPILAFSWGTLDNLATFLPRICFQKIILSPAQWKLDADRFTKDTSQKIAEEFSLWADKWDLPQQFCLVNSDLQLRLDRYHPAHIHEITTRLKKGESLHLIENFEDEWVKSDTGSHASEIVIAFSKNPIYANKSPVFSPLPYTPTDFRMRWKLPASEWVYIKLYLDKEGENRFLLQKLVPFAEELLNQAHVREWFFVRYSDPEPHLRFRFRLNSTDSYSQVSFLLHKKTLEWMEAGLIKNIVLTSYERELERYGGSEFMDAAESVFCADSLACVFLLQASTSKSFSLDPIVFHSLSVINFLSNFDLNQDDILALLEKIPADPSELKGFRKHKQQLITLTRALLQDDQQISSELENFKEASVLRYEAMKIFCKNASQVTIPGLNDIYSSMLHMHCNRLGCNASSEKQAILFARHSLLQIKHKILQTIS